MQKTWFVSDTHFWHSNVIKYTERPYVNAEEMNKQLIENWNGVVRKHDVVYHLGDFSFCGKEDRQKIFDQLRGIKKLVMGNHDSGSVKSYLEMGFKEVYPMPVLFQDRFLLSHDPLVLTDDRFVNIHGHIHNRPAPTEQHFNVSVESINYTPIELQQIIQLIS